MHLPTASLTCVSLGLDHRFNTWISRDELIDKGFGKVVSQFDDLESSREGAGARDTAAHLVRKHLEDIGLDDVHVLETCDGSVEVGGPSRVPDDSEHIGIRSTRLETRE